MSLPATLPAVLLHTILGRLASLFLTGADGDVTAARHAAAAMLMDYDPQTQDELRLAAEVISFSFHALEALGQAATPDMSLYHLLRLRAGAVNLSRASHKAQRRLDQLQKARRAGTPIPEPMPDTPAPQPSIEKAIDLIAVTRDAMADAKATGQTWTQAFQQRQRAKRIARNLNKTKPIPADRCDQAGSVALSPQGLQTPPATHLDIRS